MPLDDRAGRVSGTLRCDFAKGRIGERHNMRQHPIRATRQLTTQRDSMPQTFGGLGARV